MRAFFPFYCIAVSVAEKVPESHVFSQQRPQIGWQKIGLGKHKIYKIPVPLWRGFKIKTQCFSYQNKNILQSIVEGVKNSTDCSNLYKIRFFVLA